LDKHKFFKKVENLTYILEKPLIPLVNILGWAMFVIVIYGVFQRYIVGRPVRWVTELAGFAMIWLAMLASVICELRDEHIYITYVVDNLPFLLRRIIKLLSYLFIFFFFYLVFRESINMVQNAARQMAPALRISMQYPLAIVPVMAVFHMIAIALKIILILRPKEYVLEVDQQRKEDYEERMKKKKEREKMQEELLNNSSKDDKVGDF